MNQPVVGFSSLMNFDKLIPIKLRRSEELSFSSLMNIDKLIQA